MLCQLDDGERVPVSIESLVPVSIRSEPVVFGAADDAFRVLRVSSDTSALLGFDPIDVVGRSVLDLLDERLISSFISAARWVSEQHQAVTLTGAARTARGRAVAAQIVLATADAAASAEVFFFTIRPANNGDVRWSVERVHELEERMWRIAMEVQAAEVATAFGQSTGALDPAKVADLSSRQFEILTRLAAGERVTTIARDLFISPSTVRNHLSAVFAKFGVHSQSELFEALRNTDQEG